jgi:hypothetical protein
MKPVTRICEQCNERPAVFVGGGRLLCIKCQSDALFEEGVRRVGWHVREHLTATIRNAIVQRQMKKAIERENAKNAAQADPSTAAQADPNANPKNREGKKNPL